MILVEDAVRKRHPPLRLTPLFTLNLGKSVIEDDIKSHEFSLPSTLMLNEESRELVTWLSKDVVSNNPETPWEAVIGHSEAKQSLDECVTFPRRFPNIFESLKGSRMFSNSVNSILLFGPPGTGIDTIKKTFSVHLSQPMRAQIADII